MLKAVSKKEIEREYRRFLEDVHLKSLSDLETKTLTENMPIGIRIKEGEFKIEYIFDEEVERILASVRKQRKKYIKIAYEKHWEELFYGEKNKDAEE